jgi:hypothetical protein
MTLTTKEEKQLLDLMGKIKFPVSKEIFDAWCSNFTINTVELAVIRINKSGVKEIFLTYRQDQFFDGWHIPGSVVLPTETVESKLKKLINKEFADMVVSEPKFFCWFERVVGRDKELRGQEMGLLFCADFLDRFVESEKEKFFSFDTIPSNLIEEHKVLIESLKKEFFA